MPAKPVWKALLPCLTILVSLLSLLPVESALAAPLRRITGHSGSLDRSFGDRGLVTESWPYPEGRRSHAILAQPDGRILLGGENASGATILRYYPDGSLDTTFGDNGGVTFGPEGFGIQGSVIEMALRTDGKIIVLGERTGPVSWDPSDWYRYVTRLHPDGSIDTGFGTAGFAVVGNTGGNERLDALALQADEKIVVGGRRAVASWQFYLARLNEDGSPDAGFGGGGEILTSFPTGGARSWVLSVLIQPDGRIVAVGDATNDVAIARYEPDGTLDATFGSGGLLVSSMLVGPKWGGLQPNGSIVVGGTWRDIPYPYPDMAVTRFLPDGTLDTAFGDAGRTRVDFDNDYDNVEAGLIQADGKIVLFGTAYVFNAGSPQQAVGLARLNADGKVDTSFGRQGKASLTGLREPYAAAIALQPGGGILAGGWSLEQSDTFFFMWYLARFVP